MFQISTGGMNRASENAWQDFLVTSFEPLSCEKVTPKHPMGQRVFVSFDVSPVGYLAHEFSVVV